MHEKVLDIKWLFALDKGVGPFRYSLSAKEVLKIINIYGLAKVVEEDPSEVITWETYNFPGLKSQIYVNRDGLIESIRCADQFYLRERNIIGMNRDEVRSFIGVESNLGELCIDFYQASYYEFGFDIFYDQSWVVENVICSSLEEYSDEES